MVTARDFLNHRELRDLARKRLPRFLFDYIDRGAEDEVGLRHNVTTLASLKLRSRVLVNVGDRDCSTTVFGSRWAMPAAIGPAGSAAMLRFRGETELARGAVAAGVPFVLSGGSSLPLEDAVAIGGEMWFQLYVLQDGALTDQIIDRVGRAGAAALIVTGDTPTVPIREYNARSGFSVPFRIGPANALDLLRHPRWTTSVALRYLLGPGLPRYESVPEEFRVSVARHAARMISSVSFDWDGLADIRRRWQRPLLVKGIMTPEDAVRAVEVGVDGIVVSNHGARNLDCAPSPFDVLERIADAVGGRATVLVDGGVRRGSDVAKALALGAQAVLLGRLPLYAAAVGGAAAVERFFAILRHEFDTTMAMIGCRSPGQIDAGALYRAE